jgi:hypothetical protein
MRENDMAETELHRPRLKYVIGPDGSPLTIENLPTPGMKRWVIRRKAEVVSAVRGGLLTLEEACGRYRLTVDEFVDWQHLIDRHGLAGLRVTLVQQYRHEQAARLESGQLGQPADQQASVKKRRP